jgi:retron-type reverse transcriptase
MAKLPPSTKQLHPVGLNKRILDLRTAILYDWNVGQDDRKSTMKKKKKGRTPSPILLRKLTALENAAEARGIHVHYDRLEAAGLRLNSGLCTLKGEHHLFIEKRKSVADKIEFLENQLARDIPTTCK